ncbi:MAG: fasciclin domain-containing protein [Paludibacteraceae bacterium]|nr:fasciclin domain-containing protein [Paludibacteraceae bacterium]
MKQNIRLKVKAVLKKTALFALVAFFAYGCKPEIDERFITTFTGDMIYSYLKKDSANYSEYVKLVDMAGLKGMLSAYGEYTCLAPTNEAFDLYYKSRGNQFTRDSLNNEELNYLVRTHIINMKYLTESLSDGVIPNVNMNDRVIEILFDSDSITGKSKILLNSNSEMVEKDIEVYNGVIHAINRVLTPSMAQLPDLIAAENDLTIFSAALKLTGMNDSLLLIEDKTYDPDLYQYKDEYETYTIPCPPTRKYGYTAFVESDELFMKNGINSIEDLVAKAEEWYPSPGYENNFTNRNNSLNKFISYHLVEKVVNSNQFFFNVSAAKNTELYEFLETMFTHRIMKVSNKRITSGMAAMINPDSEDELYVTNRSKTTVNGVIHYLHKILRYTDNVEYMLSNTRIRFDFSSLMPEMHNNNLRMSNSQNNSSGDRFGIPPGYFKYINQTKDTRFIYLAGKDRLWHNYQADEMMGLGTYDLTVRLLPVPPGTYELRFGYSGSSARSVTQIYVDGKPIGIPLDLRMTKSNPKIGWVPDIETDDNGVEIDKAMRNRGFMNAPVTMVIGQNSKPLRDEPYPMRRIVGTFTFDSYEPHYIRFRSVLENPKAQAMMDYFEYVPKSVYAPPGGEPETRD